MCSCASDGFLCVGVESQAVVEFAPYPKIPSEKRKPDPRNGTIERGSFIFIKEVAYHDT